MRPQTTEAVEARRARALALTDELHESYREFARVATQGDRDATDAARARTAQVYHSLRRAINRAVNSALRMQLATTDAGVARA